MKKFILTIVAFVYLAAASGMSINMHYCMDKLVAVGMTGGHDKNCPACSKSKETKPEIQLSCKCCKDELRQVKIEKAYKGEQSIGSKISLPEIGNTFNSPEFTFIVPAKLIGSYNINAPPQKHNVPTFLFHCAFRI